MNSYISKMNSHISKMNLQIEHEASSIGVTVDMGEIVERASGRCYLINDRGQFVHY